MDRQKHDDEYTDGKKRMQPALTLGVVEPVYQLRHEARRIEGCCSFENDSDLLPVFIEGGNGVGRFLVVAAMMRVFLTVFQKIAVKLPNVVRRLSRQGL